MLERDERCFEGCLKLPLLEEFRNDDLLFSFVEDRSGAEGLATLGALLEVETLREDLDVDGLTCGRPAWDRTRGVEVDGCDLAGFETELRAGDARRVDGRLGEALRVGDFVRCAERTDDWSLSVREGLLCASAGSKPMEWKSRDRLSMITVRNMTGPPNIRKGIVNRRSLIGSFDSIPLVYNIM